MDAAPLGYWDILTDEQREILTLLASGWMTGEAARKIGMSYRKFADEMRWIYNRLSLALGRRNPRNAIWKAYMFGEIELPEQVEVAELKGDRYGYER